MQLAGPGGLGFCKGAGTQQQGIQMDGQGVTTCFQQASGGLDEVALIVSQHMRAQGKGTAKSVAATERMGRSLVEP